MAQQDAERARFVVQKADQVRFDPFCCTPCMFSAHPHRRAYHLTLESACRSVLYPCLDEQERKAAVIRAEGESESARLISEATKSAGPGMIELRRIEAAKDIADKMARGRNIAYLPKGNNTLLSLGGVGQ